MQPFVCIAISPIGSGDASLALAAAVADGIGVLDFEFCRPEARSSAIRNLRRLVESAPLACGSIGLRISMAQADEAADWLEVLRQRDHVVIVSADSAEEFEAARELQAANRRLMAELTAADTLPKMRGQSWWDGFIAKGCESGGWVGEDSAFVLAQKFASGCTAPFYVQGGIGCASAAACRAAGAAGVVLDDQLLLMPESPLPAAWRAILEKTTGQDCTIAGDRVGKPCRILNRPALKGAAKLRALAAETEISGETAGWPAAAAALMSWGDPEEFAWPLGQAVGAAADFRERFGTAVQLFRGVAEAAERGVATARSTHPLAPGSPLAESHGTRYPIAQGPMTRVSDTAEFAYAVARGGALPFLALALMRKAQVAALLSETKALLGGLPWGVGILGFAETDLRAEQIAAVREARPPFALIAGGRPDQAAELESEGIATYIHAPTPQLLKMFMEQGARRFVFEGAECGGHIGPFTSFPLWDAVVRVVLAAPAERREGVHLLFAGGIHDARSAAMAAALAAPLTQMGVRVGVLMGTAYLFTEEIVASGAIVPGFQRCALECTTTVALNVGPGHSIRCVDSPFAEYFHAERRRMLVEGMSPALISEELNRLGLGRLRLASKGIERSGDRLLPSEEERQQSQGMYMIGQAATMHRNTYSIAALHEEVSAGGQKLIEAEISVAGQEPEIRPRRRPVAIVGMAVLAPGAQSPRRFWRNLLDKADAITEVPADYWDWRLFYDTDTKAPDKAYSRWGGFMEEVVFDPVRFGIPPKSLRSISPGQLLVLEAVRQALTDAGLASGNFDRENTSVILGSDGSSMYHNQCFARSMVPLFLETPEQAFQRLPEWTEESFPGILNNVSAGRVANRFNFGGTNFLVDAACASSLKAVELAFQELDAGRSNMVVAGGVDVAQTPASYIAFSKTQALSARGRAQTFDKAADGIVTSEAVAIVILKRLEDAKRDGDRIYAVIEGVSSSSDGKAMGLTAPRPLGQQLACRRAYQAAGIAPRSIGLYEAHGTGTPVGDAAELETISTLLRADGAAAKSCAIGSLKSLIGHTKTAAGVLGLIKAALALHHKTLPPHAGVENPLDPIQQPDSPVYLLKDPRPWLAEAGRPRRAAVSAFGFGGTNTHAVLREDEAAGGSAAGAMDRPCELFAFRGAGAGELETEVRYFLSALQSGAFPHLTEFAYSCAERAWRRRDDPWVVCIVAGERGELIAALQTALDAIGGGRREALPAHIRMGREAKKAKLAFLFPGQGSQYPNMAREVAVYAGAMRSVLESADRGFADALPRPLSEFIYPPGAFTENDERRQRSELAATEVAQPGIGAVSLGFFELLRRLGVEADMVCGHSFGELTALCAAGALGREDFWRLAAARGRAMASAGGDGGAMAVISAERARVSAWLQEWDGLVLANHNAPLQCVISGEARRVEGAVKALSARGVACVRLNVSGAFHSPMMARAQEPLLRAVQACTWEAPRIPVYSTISGGAHRPDGTHIRAQLYSHLLSPVEFVAAVEAMYGDGARIFVECGPKNVLTQLVGQILGPRDHAVIQLDRSGGWKEFLQAIAGLMAAGVQCDTAALFAGSQLRLLDLDDIAACKPPEIPATAWIVNGLMARPRDEKTPQWGVEPHLTAKSAAELRGRRVSRPASAAGSAVAPAARAQAAPGQEQILTALDAHQETMRRFLALQERVLMQFLDAPAAGGTASLNGSEGIELPLNVPGLEHKNGHARGAGEGIRAPEMVEPRQTASLEVAAAKNGFPVQGRAQLAEALLQLVSESTGYPKDVVGLDMDLEAEIGIDSIKRMEVLDAFRKIAPPEIAAAIQAKTETLTRAKTLNAIVDHIHKFTEGAGAEPALQASSAPAPPEMEGAPADDFSQAPQAEEAEWECPRFIKRARLERIDSGVEVKPRGLFLITGLSSSIVDGVADKLARRGAVPVRIDLSSLESAEQLAEAVKKARRAHGPVRGIVHLAGLEAQSWPETLGDWRRQTQIQVKSLFQLLRTCAGDLESADRPIIAAAARDDSRTDRELRGQGSPIDGACAGLLRTLAKEWPHAVVKRLEFDAEMQTEQIETAIVRELLAQEGSVEASYGPRGRMIFDVHAAPLAERTRLAGGPGSDWVWLVTGGARGITAEVASSVARNGGRLLLVGKTALPEAGADEFAGLSGPALREALIARERASGKDVVPAAIEARMRGMLAGREIQHNLSRLRDAGAAAVEYHAADLRDEPAVRELLSSIYSRYGRIDAVVHGAGVIEDKRVADKDPASFARVFDTKADSAYLLAQHLRLDALKLMVFFGSIAGAFGNAGQCDYAAANELLNRLGRRIQRWCREARVVTIHWGPWEGGGMATEAVRRELRAQGILPIERGAGVRFFEKEIALGGPDEVEVIAGHGPWSEAQSRPVEFALDELDEDLPGLAEAAPVM